MIYPPCSSVFYELNQSVDKIDAKKKEQINPRLTDEEIQAIYDSFEICEPDYMVECQTSLREEKREQMRFGEIIKKALVYANRLPTARLWLRRIPRGIQVGILKDDEGLGGRSAGNKIDISKEKLSETIEMIALTMSHELAHTIDRYEFVGLSVFPYQPVNEGDVFPALWDSSLTQQELMQFVLIDEAEKAALTKQLAFEAGLYAYSSTHTAHMKQQYPKFEKLFSTWQPVSAPEQWTDQEIERERLTRAFFYASMASMSASMKEFLRPYGSLVKQMPEPVRKQLSKENISRSLNMRKIRSMHLPLNVLAKTFETMDKAFVNVMYRSFACNFLCRQLLHKYCEQNNFPVEEVLSDNRFFEKNFLTYLGVKQAEDSNEPSQFFEEYIKRVEFRYMGLIGRKDLLPKNSRINAYVHQDRKTPRKSLLDIKQTHQKIARIKKEIERNTNKIGTYFAQRVEQEMQQRSKV